jgi:ParB family chromosome partitioning protein
MAVQLKAGVVVSVPIGELERDPNQPRRTFPEEMLEALGQSMLIKIDYPLLVRVDGKRKVIYDGECRWRAAKRKKIQKLPCLLYEGDVGAVERGAGQMITSLQRSGLNPLDVAAFLVDLQKRERKSTNELLAALAKRGITDIGGRQVDRLMRLVELPTWLKDYISAGTMTEAHGIAALPALQFPEVMKELQRNVKQQLNWRGALTAKDFNSQMESAFLRIGHDLNTQFGEEKGIRQFPIAVCRSCEFYKKISGAGGAELCFNRKEFDRKNAEAMQVKAEQKAKREERAAAAGVPLDDRSNPDPLAVSPRKVKKNDDGFVVLKRMQSSNYRHLDGARFDVNTCDGCVHKHHASYDGKGDAADGGEHCFHPPCYEAKNSSGQRLESRREKLREHLEVWLRRAVLAAAHYGFDGELHHRLHIWLAAGAPEFYSGWYAGQRHAEAAKQTQDYLKHYQLSDLASFVTMTPDAVAIGRLTVCAIKTMTREQIRWLARYLQIDLAKNDPPFRISAEYLALKRKAELIELAKVAGLETVADLGVPELRQALLTGDAIDRIGVPADIEEVYAAKFQERVADLDDDIAEELEGEAAALEPAEEQGLGEALAAGAEEIAPKKRKRARA